ncbi:MAG: hypothetical protein F4051_15165, partial [Boseongicola sp. SB0670_bin_30]|nr:hypothetical protein [Boseongicola sp. SB0670_bin_30]
MIPFKGRKSLGPPRLLSRTDLIRVILRLQFEGWKSALQTDPTLKPDQNEPYMNGRLFQGMVQVRTAMGLTNIFIMEKPGVRPTPGPALPEAEPDVIVLITEFGANEPHAIIECKRVDPLENPKRLRGKYVRAGMDRFIKGLYGPDHDIDFMVAYVLDGDEPAALKDINIYLRNVKRPSDSLLVMTSLNSIGFVAHSGHVRTVDNRPFRLLH